MSKGCATCGPDSEEDPSYTPVSSHDDESGSDGSPGSEDSEQAVTAKPTSRAGGRKACCAVCSSSLLLVALGAALKAYGSWAYWHSGLLATPSGACREPYDASLMLQIAEASKAAFCFHPSRQGVQEWTCGPCARSNLSIVPGSFRPASGPEMGEENRTYGFVVKVSAPAAYAGACLVAFRGTVNRANCLTDVDAIPELLPRGYECPWCEAHAGFFQAWASVEGPVQQALVSAGCSSEDGLVVAGHSMGAAVATLAAWSLVQVHGYRLRAFYTFESPRVGNPAFRSAFRSLVASQNASAFRLTYHRDVVPHLPPVFAGFEHVGCEVYYSENGSARLCHGSEDDSCSNRWPLPETDPNLQPGPEGGEHCNTAYAGDMCRCLAGSAV